MNSTKTSKLEKFYDFLRLNKRFHKIQDDEINYEGSLIISPVEAKLVARGKIKETGKIISKSGKEIFLNEVLGDSVRRFEDGFYLNFYLSSRDKHYWRVPYNGKFVSTRVNNGKAKIPVFIGLEKILRKRDFFEKAIRKNASIGSVLQTRYFPIAMIAVGSLNVNSIHVLYKENKEYKKGEVCGYFSLGSSMLLCFPDSSLETLIKVGNKVNIGEGIVKITSFNNQ